jgi:hypothetical protein
LQREETHFSAKPRNGQARHSSANLVSLVSREDALTQKDTSRWGCGHGDQVIIFITYVIPYSQLLLGTLLGFRLAQQ